MGLGPRLNNGVSLLWVMVGAWGLTILALVALRVYVDSL